MDQPRSEAPPSEWWLGSTDRARRSSSRNSALTAACCPFQETRSPIDYASAAKFQGNRCRPAASLTRRMGTRSGFIVAIRGISWKNKPLIICNSQFRFRLIRVRKCCCSTVCCASVSFANEHLTVHLSCNHDTCEDCKPPDFSDFRKRLRSPSLRRPSGSSEFRDVARASLK